MTPLGQAVAHWLQEHAESDGHPFERSARAFTEIVVGPSSREVYEEFGVWIASGLHEVGEATASLEAGERNVTLYGVCRTKPANLAISSHEKHGWALTGATYASDDGKEYAVIHRLIPEVARYDFGGSLRDARLPNFHAALGEIPYESIADARKEQSAAAQRAEEIQSRLQSEPPSAAQSTYRDSTHLYEQVLCSSASRDSKIRAWEVHAPETIATELVSYVCGSKPSPRHSSRIERWLVSSILSTPFAVAFPGRHKQAEIDSDILRLAERCERLARRAEHMRAQTAWKWLSDPSYTEKPRIVARLLRSVAAGEGY